MNFKYGHTFSPETIKTFNQAAFNCIAVLQCIIADIIAEYSMINVYCAGLTQ